MTSSFALYFGHLSSRQLFELLPFFVHCCFCILDFHCLGHKKELVHKITMTQQVEPLLSNVIFMNFRQSPFQTLPRRFMSLYDACTCFDFWISLDSLQVSLCRNVFSKQGSAASIGISNFSLFFDGFFELLIIRISKVDATQLSRIVELRFLDSPVLLFISLTFDMLDQISDHSWSGLVVA